MASEQVDLDDVHTRAAVVLQLLSILLVQLSRAIVPRAEEFDDRDDAVAARRVDDLHEAINLRLVEEGNEHGIENGRAGNGSGRGTAAFRFHNRTSLRYDESASSWLLSKSTRCSERARNPRGSMGWSASPM